MVDTDTFRNACSWLFPLMWSVWLDLNQRPPRSERGRLTRLTYTQLVPKVPFPEIGDTHIVSLPLARRLGMKIQVDC